MQCSLCNGLYLLHSGKRFTVYLTDNALFTIHYPSTTCSVHSVMYFTSYSNTTADLFTCRFFSLANCFLTYCRKLIITRIHYPVVSFISSALCASSQCKDIWHTHPTNVLLRLSVMLSSLSRWLFDSIRSRARALKYHLLRIV